jgi:arsenate reductase (thioredoxin)
VTTILFACTHNAGRSQIAAALFNELADASKAIGVSAGTNPTAHVHPIVVDAMREIGIDVSRAKPRLLTPELARTANVLVTMGCGESCPWVPGVAIEDWGIADPKDQPIERVRAIREEIRRRVAALVRERGLSKPPSPQRRDISADV